MADPGRHRAQGLAAVVPVGVHQRHRELRAHSHDEAPNVENLLGSKREIGGRVLAHRAIRVIPGVVDAPRDQRT